jgi:hypothetical protein
MESILLQLQITAKDNIDIEKLKELIVSNLTNLQVVGEITHLDQVVGEITQSKASIYPRDFVPKAVIKK